MSANHEWHRSSSTFRRAQDLAQGPSFRVYREADEEPRWHPQPDGLGIRDPWKEGYPVGGRSLQRPDDLQGRLPDDSSGKYSGGLLI